jgi:hypothetical protein
MHNTLLKIPRGCDKVATCSITFSGVLHGLVLLWFGVGLFGVAFGALVAQEDAQA